MNRRAFLRTLAKGVVIAAAACYAPGLLKTPTFQGIPLRYAALRGEQQRWAASWEEVRAPYAAGLGGGKTDTILAQMTLAMRRLKNKKPVFYMSKATRDRLLS